MPSVGDGSSSVVGRRERNREAARDYILDAVADAAAHSRGLPSLRAIARYSGYEPPSLYSYFDGYDDLIQAFIDREVGQFALTFDRAIPKTLRFEQQLEVVLLEICRMLEARAAAAAFVAALFMLDHARGPSDMRWKGHNLYGRALGRWLADRGNLSRRESMVQAGFLRSIQRGCFMDRMAVRGAGFEADVADMVGAFMSIHLARSSDG